MTDCQTNCPHAATLGVMVVWRPTTLTVLKCFSCLCIGGFYGSLCQDCTEICRCRWYDTNCALLWTLEHDTIAQFSNDDFLVIVVIRDRYFSVIGSLARQKKRPWQEKEMFHAYFLSTYTMLNSQKQIFQNLGNLFNIEELIYLLLYTSISNISNTCNQEYFYRNTYMNKHNSSSVSFSKLFISFGNSLN